MPSNTQDPDQAEAGYRIGAVCRLTGISQHVLRVWEKRYSVVEPLRGNNQRRLYSEDDVARLTLLKALVDRGHAIGSIAGLDDAALSHRLQQSENRIEAQPPGEPPGLVLAGRSLAQIEKPCADSAIFRLTATYPELADIPADASIDIAVLAWANLYPESAAEANRIATELNLRLLILVYDFASRATLERLRGDRIIALRAPLDTATLEAVVATRFSHSMTGHDERNDSAPPPARQFTDRQLAHLAAQSGNVDCECPRHLAQIVGNLAHFEAYSAQCEARSPADATLHRELHAITSRARARMEQALQRVIEAENLSANPPD